MKKELTMIMLGAFVAQVGAAEIPYPVVDTAQVYCYDTSSAIAHPKSGAAFYGEDAQYAANAPSYKVNGDGTVSDNVTGLMWTQDPGAKMTFEQAMAGAKTCSTGGYSDWRLPSIKELYSLIQLNGTDPDPTSTDTSGLTPFIDASVFKFTYGKESDGDRIIDSQYASSTKYVSTTMGGNETLFGVNFADGRIKGYPITSRRGGKTFYVLYVRDNPAYGINDFKDNGDGTVTDAATGLTWMQADSGNGMDWPTALEYAEKMEFAGHSDWRLPNAKELQSIIDYSRSPDTTQSAAIDPIFEATAIKNEGGATDYAQYWSSSTHASTRSANAATYFAFGRALGFMSDRRTGDKTLMDVHGAGAQRSDPKVGDASQFPTGRGPQGDVIRIDNMVRLVRGGDVTVVETGPQIVAQKMGQRSRGGRKNQMARNSTSSTMGTASAGSTFIAQEDKDGDGKVARSEFGGPAAHFDQFDTNKDGFISADEAPGGFPQTSF